MEAGGYAFHSKKNEVKHELTVRCIVIFYVRVEVSIFRWVFVDS
jgi:hypothetical protein